MSAVTFLRVLGIRSKDPGVLAAVGDCRVTWNPRRGWNCQCLDDFDDVECDHIFEVRVMLDPKVTTPLKVGGLQ